MSSSRAQSLDLSWLSSPVRPSMRLYLCLADEKVEAQQEVLICLKSPRKSAAKEERKSMLLVLSPVLFPLPVMLEPEHHKVPLCTGHLVFLCLAVREPQHTKQTQKAKDDGKTFAGHWEKTTAELSWWPTCPWLWVPLFSSPLVAAGKERALEEAALSLGAP